MADVPTGQVIVSQPLALPTLGTQRTLRIYLPPGYGQSTRRYPVLYMHDGQNLFDAATSFADEWGVDETLDQLAQEGHPFIAVGIDHGNEARIHELKPFDHPKYGKGDGKAYLHDIINTVMPHINARYRTLAGPAHTWIAGSSLGGLMSHYAALHHSNVFGAAVIFSPAYWIAEPLFEETRAQSFAADQRLYFLMGGAEGEEMVAQFQRMQVIVQPQTATSRFVFVPDGEHREHFWRAQLPAALSWLLTTGERAD
ncbi:alpha/beta hydrolase [Simiduia sp. 21SJ11W-1]|uniref:alpha/beta hydrolase n=1 Tax=Simiduia sp. 21SJ11W-1 TaxID=2909669 RepID=UPI00209EE241|nr:alpha/beta hydrolase-fold protein [Simiduia sp. 21SJ11W-1]UTA47730.1 alpha/beta hydrolase [Simiduia sp. 21SJ11W-1]